MSRMIYRIKSSLSRLGIGEWRAVDVVTRSSEYFFIKKQLDTRRSKDTEKCEVTVYVSRDGKKGASSVTVTPGMKPAAIDSLISDAKTAAEAAMNPDYEQPDPKRGRRDTGSRVIGEGESIMIKALFAADRLRTARLNSAEMFFEESSKRVVTSWGTDVRWTTGTVKGEFVVQCKQPEDVEMHFRFGYDGIDPESLTARVREALEFVKDRAKAGKILKSGEYDVVLCGNQIPEVLSYYASRSNAAMIYPGYSTWKPGDRVQKAAKAKDGGLRGENLTVKLLASEPFDAEGIHMKDTLMLKDGRLKNVTGSCRFCRYIGVRPTGNFSKIECVSAGSMSFDELKKRPCLVTVAFSDFQTDDFTGNFGGEIRLGYLCDGKKVVPVTGGSVNGKLADAQNCLVFSTDRYRTAEYEGPYALLVKNVSVAGTDD